MDMDNYTDGMSIMDARRARSSGIDCWSPRDIHNWLHSTSGGICCQRAARRAAPISVYQHFVRPHRVSLFVGATSCGVT